MARVWKMMVMMKMMLFSSFFMSGMTFDMQLVKVYPKQAVLGVFEASIGNKYALNASASRDLCEHLGLRIASKTQVAEAQKHGLETCRFGWIDEQIAVVPRVQVKLNCGNGKTGVVVWRANPSAQFDVFCFNLTDFEAQASIKAHQETTKKPMTTHSAGVVHLRGSPSPNIPSLSSSVPPRSVSVVHKGDEGKRLAVSSGPTEAVPAALLITVTFAVMLAVFLTLYYFKTNRPCRAQCDVEQQKEYIETEVWEHCGKKDNNEEQVEENNEEEQVEYNNEEQVKNNNEEQVDDNDEEQVKNNEEQVEDNNEKQVEDNNEEQVEKNNEVEQVEENEEEQVEVNDEEEQMEENKKESSSVVQH